MKKILLTTIPLACVLGFVSFTAAGQVAALRPPLSIGYVSSSRVFAESTDGKAQVARLQALQQQRASELRTRQQTLDGIRQQLAQAAEGTARTQLQQQEQQQRTDLERATAQAQVDVQTLQRQVQADVQGRVKTVLDDLVKGQSIQLVLNGDQAVLWGAPGMDLTATVIERLNARTTATPPRQ